MARSASTTFAAALGAAVAAYAMAKAAGNLPTPSPHRVFVLAKSAQMPAKMAAAKMLQNPAVVYATVVRGPLCNLVYAVQDKSSMQANFAPEAIELLYGAYTNRLLIDALHDRPLLELSPPGPDEEMAWLIITPPEGQAMDVLLMVSDWRESQFATMVEEYGTHVLALIRGTPLMVFLRYNCAWKLVTEDGQVEYFAVWTR